MLLGLAGICGLLAGFVLPAVRADTAYVLVRPDSAAGDFAGTVLSCLFLCAVPLGVFAFHVAVPLQVLGLVAVYCALFAAGASLAPWLLRGDFPGAAEWAGFGIATVSAVVILPALAQLRAGYLRRHSGFRCLDCGYALLGNTSGRCPECGRAFSYEEYGLRKHDSPALHPETAKRITGIRHPRGLRAGLAIQVALVIVGWFGADLGMMQITPPGPRLHALWWSVAVMAAACSLFTAVGAYRGRIRTQRYRFAHVLAAGITVILAALVSADQIRTLGTDMWSVPHRRISLLRQQIGYVYGFDNGRRTARAPRPGDPLGAEPRALAAPLRLHVGRDDGNDPIRTGPYYQRYLTPDDIERLAYRPTPRWTDHPEIVLLYTPRPVMIRRWFRPRPDGWVALHGDGRVPLYTSAEDLRRALTKDNRTRAEMGLPQRPFEVFDR